MKVNYNGIPYIDMTDQFYGSSLESVVNYLQSCKESNKLACCEFNGTWLYSDTVTMDSAYRDVTGCSKEEFDEKVKSYHENERKDSDVFESRKTSLEQEWIEKGKKILDEKYHELWCECVPIRLDDLYRGMELGCCLEIVEALNNGCELSHALDLMEKQNHSGMSWGLVRSMVYSFCDRGQEFAEKAV